ncbi:MAG: type 2 isopentenyl-diphosphate Delta-isomerase [Actinomycetia bacterium]|nr:type 2 isopentenyl-diphosphate Delta-isomerase [Actinomycetes bacterium]
MARDELAAAIEARKEEHLRYVRGDIEARTPAGWDDIELVHQALPEVDLDAIDLSTEFLGRTLRAPLVLSAMTGGHPGAVEINANLARAAERYGIAMGVGSQRAALRAPSLAETYAVARQEAPTAFLIANIGSPQLIEQGDETAVGLSDVDELIGMIKADALAVHLNWLEEAIQPEGNHRAAGCLAALSNLTTALAGRTPVIAKETGAGLSQETAAQLADAGVAALDVGGRGGTSFAAVEGQRAADRGDQLRAQLGETFRDWGLPTPVSLIAARAGTDLPVIATGGVRSGLDAAKALALAATLVGIARPMLHAAMESEEALCGAIETCLTELASAMFLTGSANAGELRGARRIVLGATHERLLRLGLLNDEDAGG